MEWSTGAVIYVLVCVIKCSAMSANEIEEFTNFLEKTSQLDEILKKGTNPDDDFDENEPVSDHAWEESGKFEGDLVLNDRQRRLIVETVEGLSRNGLKDSTKRWPDNEVVYYIQREHFSGDQVQAIQAGIDDLAQASCVKFRPYRKGDRDAVVIQGSRRGCFSQVGYQGGYQVLNLSGRHPVGRGCFRHGTVVHELLHTLGFYHMQSSPDRDDYINVLWENIVQPARHNFRKYNSFAVSDFGVGYDYDSVLHYSRRAFSSNGKDTLVPKQGGASIGQRVGLSDKDSQKLNKMYCDADSNNYEAGEETTQKSPTKKKRPKNKPFEGHGIGYHQGKTVVIKLPAAVTIKLQDLPKIHVFDYFSKAPQAVSPTLIEGFGVGKEVEYSYKPPAVIDAKTYKVTTVKAPEKSTNKETSDSTDENIPSKVEVATEPSNNKNEDEDVSHKDNPLNVKSNSYPNHFGDDLNDAFERLGKIIKTHVYPSQMPDLSAYKKDYSDFYKPKNAYKNKKVKIFEDFVSSVSPEDLNSENNYAHLSNAKQTQLNKIKNSTKNTSTDKGNDYKPAGNIETDLKPITKAPVTSSDNEDTTNKEDSYFRTGYPLREMYKVTDEKFITPEYATVEILQDKNNFSELYHPKISNSGERSLSGTYKTFGSETPLSGDWYKKDNLKLQDDDYKDDGHTHSTEEDDAHEGFSQKPQKYSKTKKERSSHEPQKYSYDLFGKLVPLTDDWYKVPYHFDSHNGAYSLENPKSSEDNR